MNETDYFKNRIKLLPDDISIPRQGISYASKIYPYRVFVKLGIFTCRILAGPIRYEMLRLCKFLKFLL